MRGAVLRPIEILMGGRHSPGPPGAPFRTELTAHLHGAGQKPASGPQRLRGLALLHKAALAKTLAFLQKLWRPLHNTCSRERDKTL